MAVALLPIKDDDEKIIGVLDSSGRQMFVAGQDIVFANPQRGGAWTKGTAITITDDNTHVDVLWKPAANAKHRAPKYRRASIDWRDCHVKRARFLDDLTQPMDALFEGAISARVRGQQLQWEEDLNRGMRRARLRYYYQHDDETCSEDDGSEEPDTYSDLDI